EHDVDFYGGSVGGEDVPGVGGDDVGGDEVELSGKVGAVVGGDVAFERASALMGGGFDLDAEEASVAFESEVVGSGVSPGLGEHEAEFGGAGHEAKLDPFASKLAGFEGGAFWSFDGCCGACLVWHGLVWHGLVWHGWVSG